MLARPKYIIHCQISDCLFKKYLFFDRGSFLLKVHVCLKYKDLSFKGLKDEGESLFLLVLSFLHYSGSYSSHCLHSCAYSCRASKVGRESAQAQLLLFRGKLVKLAMRGIPVPLGEGQRITW